MPNMLLCDFWFTCPHEEDDYRHQSILLLFRFVRGFIFRLRTGIQIKITSNGVRSQTCSEEPPSASMCTDTTMTQEACQAGSPGTSGVIACEVWHRQERGESQGPRQCTRESSQVHQEVGVGGKPFTCRTGVLCKKDIPQHLQVRVPAASGPPRRGFILV